MLFSSLIFLYFFLPLTLSGYYLTPSKFKNYWLLLTSLIFFAWGGVSYTAILIISISFNYFFGLRIGKNINSARAHTWLVAGVACNLAMLIYFKYTDFFIQNINYILGLSSAPLIPQPGILLPVGISFYTFHSLSYLVDVYRGKSEPQRNIFNMALYICMFSQLIAGPIIRYSDVWQQLTERKHSLVKFASGIERFLIGLAKKVLLANTFAKVADTIFESDAAGLSSANAWLGLVCYSLQIYCDFAGYSDMAIGLGRMFGFDFMENFNFPFLSRSIKEFWRRWHISLSSWFNDYVFIPFTTAKRDLGDKAVIYGILFTFLLSGFWHGAGWNFILFGFLHGIAIVYDFITKKQRKKVAKNMPQPAYDSLSILFTYLYVCFTWIFFRANTLEQAIDYIGALFRFNAGIEQVALFYKLLNRELVIALVIAISGALGFFTFVQEKAKSLKPGSFFSRAAGNTFHLASVLTYSAILIMCTLYLVAGTYNPFIYFRF